MERISKREVLMAIKGIIETGELNSEVVTPAVIVEFCDKEIASLDHRAEKARERAAAKKAEGDELVKAVVAVLTDAEDFMTIADIVEAMADEYPEITAGKVQYRMNALVRAECAVKEKRKIAGEEGQKSREVTAYKLA